MMQTERPPNRLAELYPTERIEPTAMMPQQTKPMDVVFNDNNISEMARAMGAARTIHGVDLNRNALSPYQAGQLALRDKALEQQETIAMGKQGIADRRMNDYEKKTLISEIRENKNLPDSEKIKMMADVESGQITQRGDIASRLVGQRGTEARITQSEGADQAEVLAGIKAQQAKDLATHSGDIKADAVANKPLIPSQARIGKLARAEEAKNTHPEWSRYIKTIPGGGYVITPPNRILPGGIDQKTYDDINAFIEGTSDAPLKEEVVKPTEEINIKPDAAKVTPKSRYKMSIR